ncbi:dTDP-4-dehydrorhamnose reductase [Sphingobium sufflavum]|uniref:dTDP-4-dehydrorhamnose reductase n=1 Tax=Sphingobium sufflavum TaxID=1129547 RepID=UPI001F448908|nr:dTDP-4-dehydrorhamnose reductase [Sphingobium sufflavum]MCE7798388.1 dTDP-4-dehydrorhamnose reductase [Sphingobium sufflavum]
MTRHILITGGAGQVGLELARLNWPEGVEPHFPDRTELDLASKDSITAFFATREWSAVINCAAYTAVDKAESEVGVAFLANAQGPAWLAEASRNAGIPILHVSTDYVFDGLGEGDYPEDAPVAPTSVYGASKLAGEIAVRAANPRSAIVRTAWVLSAHRGNFLKTMLRVGATNPEMRVVDDQQGCPTAAADLAAALQVMVLRHLDDADAPVGTYHFVNGGKTTWCGLARTIFDLSGAAGGPSANVTGITTADYPTPARRPANSALATGGLTRDYGITPRPWQEAVRDIVAELVGPAPKE